MTNSDGEVILGKDYQPLVKRNESGIPIVNLVPSKFPYTTVNIVELGEKRSDDTIYRTATSGCYHQDKFSLEEGRLHALRLVSKTLDKPMKKAMWNAYMNRKVGG
jgi:hypothetical protein